MLSQADLAACQALLAGGSKSFHAASRVLPKRVALPATALYAWCRVADDVIDEDPGPDALRGLQRRLDAIYAGSPQAYVEDRALSAVVAGYRIPRALPDALLEGFAWDRAGRQYDDLSGVTAYAARVAGTVGAMMALLMGERRPDVLARACDLGVAMQFSNIARDVGEDARNGRLYLPRGWMLAAGVDPDAWLAAPVYDQRIAEVVARLLAEAEALYCRADAGIAHLPLACRPGIGAARRLYAAIGHQVARNGHDSVSRRAVVSGRRKLALVGRSLAEMALPAGSVTAPPLPETRFLVVAIEAETARHAATAAVEDGPIGRFVEMLLRAERARMGQRGEA